MRNKRIQPNTQPHNHPHTHTHVASRAAAMTGQHTFAFLHPRELNMNKRQYIIIMMKPNPKFFSPRSVYTVRRRTAYLARRLAGAFLDIFVRHWCVRVCLRLTSSSSSSAVRIWNIDDAIFVCAKHASYNLACSMEAHEICRTKMKRMRNCKANAMRNAGTRKCWFEDHLHYFWSMASAANAFLC